MVGRGYKSAMVRSRGMARWEVWETVYGPGEFPEFFFVSLTHQHDIANIYPQYASSRTNDDASSTNDDGFSPTDDGSFSHVNEPDDGYEWDGCWWTRRDRRDGDVGDADGWDGGTVCPACFGDGDGDGVWDGWNGRDGDERDGRNGDGWNRWDRRDGRDERNGWNGWDGYGRSRRVRDGKGWYGRYGYWYAGGDGRRG